VEELLALDLVADGTLEQRAFDGVVHFVLAQLNRESELLMLDAPAQHRLVGDAGT
jgi:hypothetical protein